jgi:hypothetical protein
MVVLLVEGSIRLPEERQVDVKKVSTPHVAQVRAAARNPSNR